MTVSYISSSNPTDAALRRDQSRLNRSAPGREERWASTVPEAAPSAGRVRLQA